jgi:hypothetical protein
LTFGEPQVVDSLTKTKIRDQLSHRDLLYRSPSIEKLAKIQQVLRSCFLSPAFLRPSPISVSNVFLEAFTELSYAKFLSQPDSEESSIELLAGKERCYNLIKQVRNDQETHSDRAKKVTGADLALLVKHTGADATFSSDPLCSFLIGALVWWHLVEGSQCADLFAITDNGKSGEIASLCGSLVTPDFVC